MVLRLPFGKVTAAERRVLFTKWLAEAWEDFTTNHQDQITNAFKRCGMFNDINGKENHLVKLDKRYPEWRHLFNELVVNVKSVESMIVVLADVMSCIQYASTEIDLGNSVYMKNVLKESKKRMREL